MRRAALYSSSRRRTASGPVRAPHTRPTDAPGDAPPTAARAPHAGAAPGAQATPAAPGRLRAFAARHERPLLVILGAATALAAMIAMSALNRHARPITQADIDAAVLHTLETKDIPSQASRAYEKIAGSVVRVRDLYVADDESLVESGVGTGVVIVDNGLILTNLHVVLGAKKVGVVFADGLESEASVVSVQPEHDLAVLKAKTLPDDLKAATMRSTADLVPGDRVVAVGFPFGIGPSVSEGVISGLRREYSSPEGKRILTNLIQFDAAANPGNSGGPLVTMDGEVVGIVTGILNPTKQRVFIGIGFAVPIENAAAGVGLSPF
jgi:S1-C subfamily serine protease